MPGRGPAPKDASVRSKRSSQPAGTTTLRFVHAEQPALPQRFVSRYVDGTSWREEAEWPDRTVEWWSHLGEAALAEQLTHSDWDFLLDTAVIHAAFVEGDLKQAAELRQRLAKYAATPEDRARLRVQWAAADEADQKSVKRQSVAPPKLADDPRQYLRAVK